MPKISVLKPFASYIIPSPVSDLCFYSEKSIGQNLSVQTVHGQFYALYSI
jgi:hypothetical protein